jgi:hypothetical protein
MSFSVDPGNQLLSFLLDSHSKLTMCWRVTERRMIKMKDNDYIKNSISRTSRLKVADNARWTSPIIRESLTIPLMMKQPYPQRSTLRDSWNMRYKDYGWVSIFWSWNRSTSNQNPTITCIMVANILLTFERAFGRAGIRTSFPTIAILSHCWFGYIDS